MRAPRYPICRGVGLYSAERVVSVPRPKKSHEACPSEEIGEEIDRLYFFEAHRDGLIVAHILPLGAVHQVSCLGTSTSLSGSLEFGPQRAEHLFDRSTLQSVEREGTLGERNLPPDARGEEELTSFRVASSGVGAGRLGRALGRLGRAWDYRSSTLIGGRNELGKSIGLTGYQTRSTLEARSQHEPPFRRIFGLHIPVYQTLAARRPGR